MFVRCRAQVCVYGVLSIDGGISISWCKPQSHPHTISPTNTGHAPRHHQRHGGAGRGGGHQGHLLPARRQGGRGRPQDLPPHRGWVGQGLSFLGGREGKRGRLARGRQHRATRPASSKPTLPLTEAKAITWPPTALHPRFHPPPSRRLCRTDGADRAARQGRDQAHHRGGDGAGDAARGPGGGEVLRHVAAAACLVSIHLPGCVGGLGGWQCVLNSWCARVCRRRPVNLLLPSKHVRAGAKTSLNLAPSLLAGPCGHTLSQSPWAQQSARSLWRRAFPVRAVPGQGGPCVCCRGPSSPAGLR